MTTPISPATGDYIARLMKQYNMGDVTEQRARDVFDVAKRLIVPGGALPVIDPLMASSTKPVQLDDITAFVKNLNGLSYLNAPPMPAPLYWQYGGTAFGARTTGKFTDVPIVEPAKLSDCPHKPGTIEHRDWVRENIIDKQQDARTDAYQGERERIAGLINNRRERYDTDRARRTEALDAMIAELP